MKFARSYKKFGLQALPNGDIVYTEWAPEASALSLVLIYD
jgi:1,4-alpha-glucan branching enzyme